MRRITITVLGAALAALIYTGSAEVASAHPFPSGAVVAFDQETCPEGWEAFMPARGRVIIGAGDPGDADSGLSTYSLRDVGGAETHVLKPKEMPNHSHRIDEMEWGHTINGNGHPARIDVDDGPPYKGWTGNFTTSGTGGGKPHNNMPPYVALYYCKKK